VHRPALAWDQIFKNNQDIEEKCYYCCRPFCNTQHGMFHCAKVPIPFGESDTVVFLKTIIPSRKAFKRYAGGPHEKT
jgi:hypothetical protein